MKLSTKILILTGVLIMLVLGIIIANGLSIFKSPYLKVEITTDKAEYSKGEILLLTIKNNLEENLCFSSCYPYYLERKNQDWKSYDYGMCNKANLAEKCINAGGFKTFEIDLSSTEKGSHRFTIPGCINCEINGQFTESKRFYSNEFEIK